MQLFVSYARSDAPLVQALVTDVHALGHQAFFDRDLAGGQRWWDALLDQIEQAEVFVPVLSDAYRDSAACRAEAEWAESLGLPFLPITTGQQTPGFYDPVIAEANWVTFDPESREALADLARALGATSARTPPDVPPSRPAIPLSYLNTLDRQIRGADEIGRGDQLALISDLRSKLDTRDDPGARELLLALRARPEITYEAATTIDDLLRTPPPKEPAAAGRGSAPSPAPAVKAPKLRRPRPARPEPSPGEVPADASKEPSTAGAMRIPPWWPTAVTALLVVLFAIEVVTWTTGGRGGAHVNGFDPPLVLLVLILVGVAVASRVGKVPVLLRNVAVAIDLLLALSLVVYMVQDSYAEPVSIANTVGYLVLAGVTFRPGEGGTASVSAPRSRAWLAVVAVGAALALSGISWSVWVDHDSHTHRLFGGGYVPIELAVALALLVAAAIALAIACQLRSMPRVVLQVAAVLDLLVAVVAVVATARAGELDELGLGPWLVGVGMVLLALATYPISRPDRPSPASLPFRQP